MQIHDKKNYGLVCELGSTLLFFGFQLIWMFDFGPKKLPGDKHAPGWTYDLMPNKQVLYSSLL